MGDKRTINTAGGDYAEGNIDKRQGTFIGEQHNYFQPPTAPLDRQQQRYRRAMLAKVKSIWIEGLLEQSLAKELRIVLDLTEQPNAVDLPLNALVQELNRSPRPLSAGTPIIQVFEQMGGALLILGAPGAGKTTLLLELARDLIARAEQDEGHPIPVVFNLSTWATKRQPLKEWLVEELNTKYDVPRKLAQTWIEADVVLPLLDGLDEVAANYRGACVEAINTYREEHGLVPLTVCSRVPDYEVLRTNLHLQGAIVVQPLTLQ
jgi:predicted NACHT family NTPase